MLSYLIDPNIQIQDKNGLNNTNGTIKVYYSGTDDIAVTYRNFDGAVNPAVISLDNNGRAVIIADEFRLYRMEVYSSTGAMLWTQDNVKPQTTGRGPQGEPGPQGPQGEQGEQGEPGTWEGIVDEHYNSDSTNPQSGTAVAEAVSGKANKAANATAGNLAALDANGNLTDSGKKAADFKTKQSAVTDPTADGTGLSFIDSVMQNANGEITPHKKTVQDGSTTQKGVVQLEDSFASTSTTTAATPNAVKAAYDLAATAVQGVKVNGTELSKDSNNKVDVPVPTASTSNPLKDGTASAGSSSQWARGDHRHPTDDSREAVANKKQSIDPTSTTEYGSSKALADFVNSSVATNTANFLGTISESSLGLDYTATNAQIELALNVHSWESAPTNNDYCFVSVNDPQTTDVDEYRRFKYNDKTNLWGYEYTLNNSSFTQAQWDAINSGLTSSDRTAYNAAVMLLNSHVGNGDIHVTAEQKTAWTAKQDALPKNGTSYAIDISGYADRAGSAGTASRATTATNYASGGGIDTALQGKYVKPSGGIPKTDLAIAVQTSLGKADSALQSHQAVSDNNPTLAWGATSKVGTVGGTDLRVTMPSNPASGKADKVLGATAGNLAALDANGNLTDSGKKAADFAVSSVYNETDPRCFRSFIKCEGFGTQFYRKLATTISINDSGNYSVIKLEGCVGSWSSSDTTDFSIVVRTRGTILFEASVFKRIGSGNAFNKFDFELYEENDGTYSLWMNSSAAYTKCAISAFAYGGAYIVYDGNYGTPTGTLVASASQNYKVMMVTDGDGSNVSVTPDGTSTGTDIGSSTTLKVWAQKFKNLVGSLKALAFKDTAGTSDIADDAITAAKVKDNETLPANISGRAASATTASEVSATGSQKALAVSVNGISHTNGSKSTVIDGGSVSTDTLSAETAVNSDGFWAKTSVLVYGGSTPGSPTGNYVIISPNGMQCYGNAAFAGNLVGNASTASGVKDYNDANKTIEIGYTGDSLTSANYLAAYAVVNGRYYIKDISPSNVTVGRATADGSGNNIVNTYQKKMMISTCARGYSPTIAAGSTASVGNRPNNQLGIALLYPLSGTSYIEVSFNLSFTYPSAGGYGSYAVILKAGNSSSSMYQIGSVIKSTYQSGSSNYAEHVTVAGNVSSSPSYLVLEMINGYGSSVTFNLSTILIRITQNVTAAAQAT